MLADKVPIGPAMTSAAAKLRLTVLCDDTVASDDYLAEHGLLPAEAMEKFEDWVLRETPSGHRPVFVAFNAPFDWMFVCDYFYRYLGRNPFGHNALDIKALYMGLSGVQWHETSMPYVAARYLDNHPLTHNALHDSQDQAEIMRKILAERDARSI